MSKQNTTKLLPLSSITPIKPVPSWIKTDLTGKQFHQLFVLGFSHFTHSKSKPFMAHWFCKCECGNIKTVASSHIKRQQSCGCANLKPKNLIHGQTNSFTHNSWTGMIRRCTKPCNAHDKKNYLDRGIQVCDRWLFGENGKHPFICFLEDLGERISSKYSLERRDNDGNYEPSNCYWATDEEQRNNTRSNTFLTHKGQTLTISQWARKIGICKETIISRLYIYNWSVDKTLTEPIKRIYSHQKNRR